VKQEATEQEEKPEWDEIDEENLLKDDTNRRRNKRKLKCRKDNDEDEGK